MPTGKARTKSVDAAKRQAAVNQIVQRLQGAFGDYVRAQAASQPQGQPMASPMAQQMAAPPSAVAQMAPPPQMMAPPIPPPVAPPPMPVAPPMGPPSGPPMLANLSPELLAFIQSQRRPMPAMPVIDPRRRF